MSLNSNRLLAQKAAVQYPVARPKYEARKIFQRGITDLKRPTITMPVRSLVIAATKSFFVLVNALSNDFSKGLT